MAISNERIEEITRVVLDVLEQQRPASPPRRGYAQRLTGWSADNPTATLALLGLAGLALALIFFRVEPWTVAGELAGRYREAQQRSDLIKEHLQLGDRFLSVAALDAARAEYERALELEPTNVEAQRGVFRATIFAPIAEKEVDPAIAAMRLSFLLERDEDDAHARAFLGDVYYNQRRYSDALKEYLRAVEEDDSLAHAYSGAGTAYALLTPPQRAKAIRMQRKAVELAPDDQSYRTNLAYELLLSGDYGAARTQYEKIIFADPEFLVGYAEGANAYRLDGNVARAAYLLDFVLPLFSDPRITGLARNQGFWTYRPLTNPHETPRLVELINMRQKHAYMLLSRAFTAWLQEKKAVTRARIADVRKLRLPSAEARDVRTVVLDDVARFERGNKELRRTTRAFRELVRGFGV